MTDRSEEDYQFERASLDTAHYQNEISRDTFLGLGHTAIFASSIAFASDIQSNPPFLLLFILSLLCNTFGLLAIAYSFGAARRAIDARRIALNESQEPNYCAADWSNSIATWAFGVSLLSIFSFITIAMMGREMTNEKSSPPNQPDYGTFGATPAPRAPAFQPSPTPGTGVIPSPRPQSVQPRRPHPHPQKNETSVD